MEQDNFFKDFSESSKIEDIKRKYYTDDNKCQSCGQEITKFFIGHIKTHIKKWDVLNQHFLFDQGDNKLDIKCKVCQKKFRWSNCQKQLLEHSSKCNNMPSSTQRGNQPSSTQRGNQNSFSLLEKKLDETNKKLEETKKELDKFKEQHKKEVIAIRKTHGTLKSQVDNNTIRIGDLEKRADISEKMVRDHANTLETLLQQLVKQGQYVRQEGASTSIFDRFKPRNNNNEDATGRTREVLTREEAKERERDRIRTSDRYNERERNRERSDDKKNPINRSKERESTERRKSLRQRENGDYKIKKKN